MINIQPIEKIDHRDDFSLDIHSIFPTIQGEGPLTGHPCIFIRLAGCNLQCPGCDTDYTSKRERMSPEAILARVRALHPGPRLVVITGGEPFRQDLKLLVNLLVDEDYQVQVETNGTLPPPEGLPPFPQVWIVVSPKAGKVHPLTAERACAWKYVLSANSVSVIDGLPILALNHSAWPTVARPPVDFPVGAVYLQPMDVSGGMGYLTDAQLAEADGFEADYLDIQNERNLEAVRQSCMKFGYTLQLQIHKILGVE